MKIRIFLLLAAFVTAAFSLLDIDVSRHRIADFETALLDLDLVDDQTLSR